jgi:hypothetical protein
MTRPTPSQPSGSAPSPLSPRATSTSETMPFGSLAFLPAAAKSDRNFWAGFLPRLPTRDHRSVLGPLLALHLSEKELHHLAKESATLKWGKIYAIDPRTGKWAVWEYWARVVLYKKTIHGTHYNIANGLLLDLHHTIVRQSPRLFMSQFLFCKNMTE